LCYVEWEMNEWSVFNTKKKNWRKSHVTLREGFDQLALCMDKIVSLDCYEICV
jgi:hypothetical protein